MSTSYRAQLIVGTSYDDIQWSDLTEYAQQYIISEFIKHNSPVDEDELDEESVVYFEDSAREWFYENMHEFLAEDFGLQITGNYFQGWFNKVGVSVSLHDLESISDNVDKAREEFDKWFKVQPTISNEVTVY
jgi:hypothetical protein